MKNTMTNSNLKLFVNLFLILFFTTSTFAAVEIFSTFDTKIKINNDETIDITKHIVLQNTHIVGIVPGRIEFKISKDVEGSVSELNLDSFKAVDRYGNDIKSQILETPKQTIIALDIFQPLLPGFQYIIDLDYKISYESSGLLFKNLQLPIKEDTSIEIIKGKFEIQLPNGKHFTYFSLSDINKTIENNTLSFNIDGKSPASAVVEYSPIPIFIDGLKGSYMFWLSINLILLMILAFEIIRGIKKLEPETKKKKNK